MIDDATRFSTQNIHASVENLIFLHGIYSPVELLIQTGLLQYEDYEAWRLGQISVLADTFFADLHTIQHGLSHAASFAKQLGLTAEYCEYLGWSDAYRDKKLCFFLNNRALEKQLKTHYVRHEVAQLDMFLDGGTTAVCNDLIQALTSRQPEKAITLFKRLRAMDPHHPQITLFRTLCTELQIITHDMMTTTSHTHLEKIENQLIPIAKKILGTKARDYLAPFWQYQANLTAENTFDPSQPHLHQTWAYVQLLHWSKVRDTIQTITDWATHPWLCCRLAEALYHLSTREQAISVLIKLCWHHPDAFETDLAESSHLDRGVKNAWKAFLDIDFATPLETPFFPAYMLLHEPSLINLVDVAPTDTAATHQNAYFSVYRLLSTKTPYKITLNKKNIRLRTMLQASHPDLFMHYLEKFGQQTTNTSSYLM